MFITIVLFTVFIIFLLIGYKLKSWQVLGYSLVCLLVFCLLEFYKTNPGIIIKSQYLTIEKQVDSVMVANHRLEETQKEVLEQQKKLQEVTTTLTKMILVVEDGVGKFGDTRPQRDKLLAEYKKQIEQWLPHELQNQVEHEIQTLYSTPKK